MKIKAMYAEEYRDAVHNIQLSNQKVGKPIRKPEPYIYTHTQKEKQTGKLHHN